jgi:AraC-like DNA-binding protein
METVAFSPPLDRPRGYQLDAWSGFVSEHFFPLQIARFDNAEQLPVARGASAGPFQVTEIRGKAAIQLQRRSIDIARDRNPRCAIFLPLKGRHHFTQFNREAAIAPGEMLFVDPTEPYDHIRFENNVCLYFLAPLSYMTERLADARALGAHAIQCREGIAAATASLMSGLLDDAERLSQLQFEIACRTLTDLLALTLGAWAPEKAANSSVRSANLTRVKRHIRRNISRSGLTAIRIADECKVSERYLHELFSSSGHTVGQFIREERLLMARERLSDPRYGLLSVTQIALDCGFSHSSHLSNCFKTRFDETPTEFRQKSSMPGGNGAG